MFIYVYFTVLRSMQHPVLMCEAQHADKRVTCSMAIVCNTCLTIEVTIIISCHPVGMVPKKGRRISSHGCLSSLRAISARPAGPWVPSAKVFKNILLGVVSRDLVLVPLRGREVY